MSIFGSTRRPPRWKPVVGTPINGGHPLVRQMVLCLLCNEGAGKILKNSVFPVVDGTLSNPAWKTLSSYQFYQDGVPLAMSSSQNNPQNPQRSDAGGNILSVSTSAVWDHLLAWKGRALTASDIRDLYVNPFSFMYVNQRSRILEAAAGVKTQRKPFVFTVT